MAPGGFSYEDWSLLLDGVVTDEGKVDYLLVRERRDLLDRFLARLAEASPENRPDLFPDDPARLAYWINAYNAFTLHAVLDEYPLSSVWKTPEGRFFQRRGHVAGGREVSLDDVEHEILRTEFAEPRIHFAINCGANGCPPLRPRAYEPEALEETLRQAAVIFLRQPGNFRVDHDERRVWVSRLFKMYAGDFAGRDASTADYRRHVLAFVARHTGLEPEAIADYEVHYNTYDWGLNDARREPHLGPITFHDSIEHFAEGDKELRELHLYEGNFCNRACSWCTIDGSPEGWYRPYAPAVLNQALATVARDGNIKFYGGEPTLHAGEIVRAMRHLRGGGFTGLFTIFSNGIKAERLIEILESDERSEAVLNYSIFHGRDAEPLPPAARARLEEWAASHPHRLFQGYKLLFHAGGGADQEFDQDREAEFNGVRTGCLRCFPVLTSKGRLHACPYAVEIDSPHYDLGGVGSDPATAFQRYREFRRWVDEVLDPAARARGVTSCEMCHRYRDELPTG